MKTWIGIITKVVILLGILLLGYYLLLLRLNKAQEKNVSLKTEVIRNKDNLVQNRISYVELTRLDPESPNFDNDRSYIAAAIKKTNKEGLENQPFPAEAKQIYERQNKLLEKIFATKSYEEGVAILKSQEALQLLTDQTNLILEWEFQQKVLEKESNLIQSQSGLKRWLTVLGLYHPK